jgi:hypothetical protein
VTVIVVLTLLTLLLQEFLHRHYQDRSQGLAHHVDERSSPGASRSWRHAVKQLRAVRMVQLFLTMLLFAVVAGATGHRVLVERLGQVAALILLLQLVRIVGRRVIDRWIVLTILGLEQAVLLLLLPFLGRSAQPAAEVGGLGWLGGAAAVLGTAALSISFAFAAAFLIKLRIPERSGLFYELPPLVVAEAWARRLSTASTVLFLASFAAFLTGFLTHGGDSVAAVVVGGIAVLLLAARLASRRPAAYHTGLAVLLVLANLGALGLVIAGGLSPGA